MAANCPVQSRPAVVSAVAGSAATGGRRAGGPSYTQLHKLPFAYIISTPWHSPTHLSFLTATLLLSGDIQLNPGPTLLSNILFSTLNAHSMLTPEHVTALNDLTDNHKPDIIALTETDS